MVNFMFLSTYHSMHHVFYPILPTGTIKTYDHLIPQGGWFRYVSCPHYLAEVLIYLAFIVVVGPAHKTVWSVVVYVWGNQAVAAWISHQWYKTNFSNYPKERFALIPYTF